MNIQNYTNNKILFVDDELFILKSIKRGLIDEDFDTTYATSAKEALEVLEKESFAVIVSDLRMPEMGGIELMEIVREKYPEVVRIVLTAYTQTFTILSAINSGQLYHYLTKPFKVEQEVIPVIKNALDYHKILVQKRLFAEKLETQNEVLKKSEKVKTQTIHYLADKIIPYVADVIHSAMVLDQKCEDNVILEDLTERGKEILDLLRKVEGLLRK